MQGWGGWGKAGLTAASCLPWRMLLGGRSKGQLPAEPHRDVNVTLAVTWQPPASSSTGSSRAGSAAVGNGKSWHRVLPRADQYGGGLAGTNGSPHLRLAFIPVYAPWDPRGAEECVCEFLCSDFLALPLAVTGSSRRAGVQGASRARGQLTLAGAGAATCLVSSVPSTSVPSSASCLLEMKSKRGLDPRLFTDLLAASTPLGCVPACIPAIWQLSPAGPVHPPGCLGRRKWEQAGISPQASPQWPRAWGPGFPLGPGG